jgi:hypothetical protein
MKGRGTEGKQKKSSFVEKRLKRLLKNASAPA